MENAAKALEIAAGVLIGVILLTVIAYFFSTISIFPQEESNRESAEQLSKFNLEYEVYDKKAMYGADVISCLAKAQSNNEKYVEGGSFITGNKYGERYWINVYIDIDKSLTEELIVYKYDNAQKVIAFDVAKVNGKNGGITAYTMSNAGFRFGTDAYTTFNQNTELGPQSAELTGAGYLNKDEVVYTYKDVEYNGQLYKKAPNGEPLGDNTPLKNLVTFSSVNMKQTVTNNTGIDLDQWCYAEWRTALYDFKTRRFKCDDITYSELTGRVDAIFFSEI